LKSLGDDERRYVLRWLLTYFGDDGRMMSPAEPGSRRRIAVDGSTYLLVSAGVERERK
jgi:hypothetical protein